MNSKRLQYIRSFYQSSQIIWDVGCDHGELGFSFVTNDEVEKIYLVDPSLEVINKLKSKDSYITNPALNILHERGQNIVPKIGKTNTIFIAGMGGKEIQSIIESLIPKISVSDRVIISPHRKILELRAFLHSSCLRLVGEGVTSENDQFYQVLALEKNPLFEKVSLYGGAHFWGTEIGKKYAASQLSSFQTHRDELSSLYVKFLKSIS